MKRVKVTKRPVNSLVLRPARLRMFAIYVILLTLALSFGLVLRMITSSDGFNLQTATYDWPLSLAIVFGGSAIMVLLEYRRLTLRFDGDHVEGPAGAFGERQALNIKEIDWLRTRNSLSSRLKFGNAIYTYVGQRIIVSPWFFHPERFEEFLSALGVNKAR